MDIQEPCGYALKGNLQEVDYVYILNNQLGNKTILLNAPDAVGIESHHPRRLKAARG